MKNTKYLLLFLFILPVLVNASTFSGAKNISNVYYKQFLYPERYLVESTNSWGLNASGEVVDNNAFTKGGLITEREIKITSKGQKNYFSYMYDGTNFWEISGKIVSENMISGSEAKTKVTEYVKHSTKVSGIGTYENPWIFVDTYKVSVESNGNGKIDGENISTKDIDPTQREPVTFSLEPDDGYKYSSHTCGSYAKVLDNKLTISSVEKDMTCKVIFSESRNSVTLPKPCFEITTKLYGKRKHCFKDPVYNQFYYRYNVGYFSNEELTTRVGKLTEIPVQSGWTFDGYYVGSSVLINSNGVYETTYTLLNEKNTKIVAKGHANTYTIIFDKQGGKPGVGTDTISVVYDHDLPTIVLPKRDGYAFQGYYTGKNGGGKQYYKANGSEADTWSEAANTTLYAKWKDVTKPTCVVNYDSSTNGSTSGVKVTTVTCTDHESGCKIKNKTINKTFTSGKSYSVYDNEGNEGTCSITIKGQKQKATKYCSSSHPCIEKTEWLNTGCSSNGKNQSCPSGYKKENCRGTTGKCGCDCNKYGTCCDKRSCKDDWTNVSSCSSNDTTCCRTKYYVQ